MSTAAPTPPPPPRFPPQAVTVVSSRNSEGRNSHTLYVLIVEYDPQHQWTIERRFSEFEDLRTALSEFIQGPALPLLPAKTFTRSLDPGFIAWRRKELDRWMQHVLQSEFVQRSVIFAHFCGVQQQLGEKAVGYYLPVETKSMTDPQFGLNDCFHHEKDGVMFTACEDVNVLSKLERKLTNIRLPWEAQGCRSCSDVAACIASSSTARLSPRSAVVCAGGVAPLGCCAGWKLSESGDWKPKCVV